MKKLWALVGISVMLFFSCATSVAIVFDDSVPVAQSARIGTGSIGVVTGYNGIAVNWKPGNTETIQIPAGDTILQWDVKTPRDIGIQNSKNYYIYELKNALFRYNFQPQKMYFFLFSEVDRIEGLNVHAYDFGEKVAGTKSDFETHFVAFVPFENAPGSQKAVLE